MNTMTNEHEAVAPPPGAAESLLLLAGAGFLIMAGFVFGYGYHGERITAGLDRACAQAAFMAGKKQEALGNDDAALQRYRQAMEGYFGDSEQRILCGRSMGELLSRQQRHAEAVAVFRELPPEAFSEAGHYTAYVLSLWHDGNLKRAAELGGKWLDLARQEQNEDQIRWALNALMHVSSLSGQTAGVLEYGEALLQMDPESEASLVVARAMADAGRPDEARELLDTFIRTTDSPRHQKAAKDLREQLGPAEAAPKQ